MDYTWDGLLKRRKVDFQNTQSEFKNSYTVEQKQDSLGRIAEVLVDGRMVLRISYDEFNRVLTTLDGEGGVRKPVYDSVTRQSLGWKEAGAQGEKSFGWHFDERGFLASESFEAKGAALVKIFAYDASGFLNQETGRVQTQTYAYDSDGLRSIGRLVDESGRLRSAQANTLSYGPDGQLESAVSPSGLLRYSHDLSGQRILKFKNGNIDTAFAGKLVMKGNRIFEILFHQGQTYGILENGQFKSLAADHIGTPFALRDGSLDVPSAFGDGRRDEEREILAFAKEGRDIDTGLVRFGVRDYEIATGMFTTPDPLFLENPENCIRSPVECNLYSYGRNNPLKYVDPTGNIAETVLDVASIGAGIYSISQWDDNTSLGAKALDVGGLAVDGIAAAIPFVPGGASLLLKGVSTGNKLDNTADTAKILNQTRFPTDPNNLTKILGVEPKFTTTLDGTLKMKWEPNANTRIRYESHPGDLMPDRSNFNPRHHSEHYHVETKASGTGWNQATKAQPDNYTLGMGTGFLPGEKFPGR
jgi:RHS repeat-associated protein